MKSYRNMRLIVFFDLPTETKDDRRNYTKFRKFLLRNGFDMLQFSVYTRFCRNDTDSKKHIKRVKDNKPKTGSVRLLRVTDAQYDEMVLIQGEYTSQEKNINADNLLVIE